MGFWLSWGIWREATQRLDGRQIKLNEYSEEIVEYPISKPEQTKIAEVLSTVDRAIEQTEALIAKQQRLKTGLMQDLLTRGIDEHGNLRSEETHKFKDSPLVRIPVEWETTTLGELGLWTSGGTPSKGNQEFWDGEILWVTPRHEVFRSGSRQAVPAYGSPICALCPKIIRDRIITGSEIFNNTILSNLRVPAELQRQSNIASYAACSRKVVIDLTKITHLHYSASCVPEVRLHARSRAVCRRCEKVKPVVRQGGGFKPPA
jgi:hypothetical protein